MIGNAHAFLDTGFSILEEGDIDAQTLSLTVHGYLAVDRQASVLGRFTTRLQAEDFLAEVVRQKKESQQQ